MKLEVIFLNMYLFATFHARHRQNGNYYYTNYYSFVSGGLLYRSNYGIISKNKKNIEIQNRIVPSNKTNIRSIE